MRTTWRRPASRAVPATPTSRATPSREDGTRIFYEVYGEGDRTLLFVPPWAIVHSRLWKAQIPYFARRARVIVFDPRGNGRSDRPADLSLYSEDENAADIGAVLDATGTARAVLVTMSRGCQRSLLFAAEHPERVEGAVFMSCGTLLSAERRETDDLSQQALPALDVPPEVLPALNWFNREAWQRDPENYRAFLIGSSRGSSRRTRRSTSRTRSAGGSRRTARRSPRRTSGRSSTPIAPASSAPASSVRPSCCTGPRTTSPRSRKARRWPRR